MTPEDLLREFVGADLSDLLALGALQSRAADLLSPKHNPIVQVLKKYAEYHPQAKPGDLEKKKIKARLTDGYTADHLCLAIDGCHKSPHHCGSNDRGTKYQSLALIMRDSSQVQKFIEIAQGEGMVDTRVSSAGRKTLENANRFLQGGG